MNAQIFDRRRLSNSLPLALAVAAVVLVAPAQSSWAQTKTVDLDESPWIVNYFGRSYDADRNETTFGYHVFVNGDPGLLAFALDLPAVEPALHVVRTAPEGSVVTEDPSTGSASLRWDLPLGPWDERIYSLTLRGNLAEGEVAVAVDAGIYLALGVRPGPSGESLPGPGPGDEIRGTIAGVLYLDADGDAAPGPMEPRFPAVTVVLLDDTGLPVDSIMTLADGSYRFQELPEGSYVLAVFDATPVADFNESLHAYFSSADGFVRPVVLGSIGAAVVDFGFVPNVVAILEDLDPSDPDRDGFTFDGTGRNVRFWERQLSAAERGRGHGEIDAVSLAGYVDWIRLFYLVEPFQFADDFLGPRELLSSNSREPADVLARELLAAEFNHAAGWGLGSGHDLLQMILLQWGEILLSRSGSLDGPDLGAAAKLFEAINASGE